MLFFASNPDYRPVHNMKAVVVNATSVVLSWEKPVDVTNVNDIMVWSFSWFYCERTPHLSHPRFCAHDCGLKLATDHAKEVIVKLQTVASP